MYFLCLFVYIYWYRYVLFALVCACSYLHVFTYSFGSYMGLVRLHFVFWRHLSLHCNIYQSFYIYREVHVLMWWKIYMILIPITVRFFLVGGTSQLYRWKSYLCAKFLFRSFQHPLSIWTYSEFWYIQNLGILRIRGIFRTLVDSESWHIQNSFIFIILAYSEHWYIQNPRILKNQLFSEPCYVENARHVQNPLKLLWWNVLQK